MAWQTAARMTPFDVWLMSNKNQPIFYLVCRHQKMVSHLTSSVHIIRFEKFLKNCLDNLCKLI
jgi:hypothetical protein